MIPRISTVSGAASIVLGLLLQSVGADPLNEIVVFGASYCQSGEETPAGQGPPGNVEPYYGGRWSNGLVFGEYMKNATQATLYDYGVGGAHIDPSLTDGGYYSSEEVEAYLEGIEDGSLKFKRDGITLHVWWVGLNPVKEAIWANLTTQPNITNENLAYANLQARQNAEAVLGQATTVAAALEPYDDINGVMLLLPIPPTEDVPQTKYGATNSTQQLDALAQITETFNAGIWNGSSNSGNQSSSFLYWAADNWWKDLSQRDWQPRGPYEGTSLSLDVVETACLVPKDGTQCAGCRDIEEINVCDNPQNYLYWDALHPTTVVQEDLSQLLLQHLQFTNATNTEPTSLNPERSLGSGDDDDDGDSSCSITLSSSIDLIALFLVVAPIAQFI